MRPYVDAVRRYRRRAGIYFIVLGTSMVVLSIGMLGLTIVRVQRRTAAGSDHLAQARLSAQSAIEHGLQYVNTTPNWRDTRSSGAWITNQAFAGGTISLAGVDPSDGDLADEPMDPLQLTGTGSQGQASYQLRVSLSAEAHALSSLDVPLHTGGNMNYNGATVTADAPISSNGSINASGSTINADVESLGTTTGATYTGTQTTLPAAREMPDATSVFDYYINRGTPIPISALPRKIITLERVLSSINLGPLSNPFGAVNPEGIYLINAGNTDVYISNSIITGTLVILDPGPNSRISGNMNWQVGLPGHPALLVRGDIEIATTTNPDGGLLKALLTGVTGLIMIDPGTVTLRADGLFYVSGDLVQTGGTLPIDGNLIVGGNLTSSGGLTISYDGRFKNTPPPGFLAPPTMVVDDSSWKPIVQ